MEPANVSSGRAELYKTLRMRAAELVREEFDLIDVLAIDHVRRMQPNRRGWSFGLEKHEVDSLPKIVSRFQ